MSAVQGLFLFFKFKPLEAFRFQLRTQAGLPESAIAFGYKIKDKKTPQLCLLKKVLRDFLSKMKQVPKLSLKVYILSSFHVYNLWNICQE